MSERKKFASLEFSRVTLEALILLAWRVAHPSGFEPETF
jgi:hypothetical protein